MGIFVPQDQTDVITKSWKKFIVEQINEQDFVPIRAIDPYFTSDIKEIKHEAFKFSGKKFSNVAPPDSKRHIPGK